MANELYIIYNERNGAQDVLVIQWFRRRIKKRNKNDTLSTITRKQRIQNLAQNPTRGFVSE